MPSPGRIESLLGKALGDVPLEGCGIRQILFATLQDFIPWADDADSLSANLFDSGRGWHRSWHTIRLLLSLLFDVLRLLP